MKEAWARIEAGFRGLARLASGRPWLVLALTLAPVVFLASALPRLRIDTSVDAMLRADDPIRTRHEAFMERFGRDDRMVVGVRQHGPLDAARLARLEALQRALEEDLPHVVDVDSLLDARHVRGEGATLVVEPLLEDWRALGRPIEDLLDYAAAQPTYRGHFLSETPISASGERLLAFWIETEAFGSETSDDLAVLEGFEEDAEDVASRAPGSGAAAAARDAETLAALDRLLSDFDDLEIVVSGTPVVLAAFDEATMRDMVLCGCLCTTLMALVLALFFRRLSGILLPLWIVESSVLASLGAMAWLGVPFTLSTNGIVVFLITVGICNAVHVLARFYRAYDRGASRADASSEALERCGPAVVMAGLTTAGGLLSFSAAELAAVADLGLFAAFGILVALVLSLAQLPALLEILPVRRRAAAADGAGRHARLLLALARTGTRWPRAALTVSLVLTLVSIGGLGLLGFSHDPVMDLPSDRRVVADLRAVDEGLSGAGAIEIEIDGRAPDAWTDPELLAAIDRLPATLEAAALPIETRKVFSLVDIVKEVDRALSGRGPEALRLPTEQAVIAQELLLFEMSGAEDLETVVDGERRIGRVTLAMPHADGVDVDAFMTALRPLLADVLPSGVDFHLTGSTALTGAAIPLALESLARSYALALVIVSALMILMIGELRLGLLAMIPNLLPIGIGMGLMGHSGTPLDMTTMVLGSIALGLVVDDTLHFMHGFRRAFAECGHVEDAVETTLLGAGPAMSITTLLLCVGFGSDLLASLENVQRFGSLVALIAALALLADLIVAPALVRLFVVERPEPALETAAGESPQSAHPRARAATTGAG